MDSKKVYVSFNGFDGSEMEWYLKVIKVSFLNKITLLTSDPELALNIFCRYEDKVGLQIVLASMNLPEKYRKIAEMQLASLFPQEYSLSCPVEEEPGYSADPDIVKGLIEDRDKLIRRLNSVSFQREPSDADFQYHGPCADI